MKETSRDSKHYKKTQKKQKKWILKVDKAKREELQWNTPPYRIPEYKGDDE